MMLTADQPAPSLSEIENANAELIKVRPKIRK